MKKFLFFAFVTLLGVACGSEPKAPKGDVNAAPPSATTGANANETELLTLMGKYDCNTCHKITEKVIGPSYMDVANKYAGMPDTIVTHLANKIVKGGSGVWGDVPMAPHATIVPADAESMVKHILALK